MEERARQLTGEGRQGNAQAYAIPDAEWREAVPELQRALHGPDDNSRRGEQSNRYPGISHRRQPHTSNREPAAAKGDDRSTAEVASY